MTNVRLLDPDFAGMEATNGMEREFGTLGCFHNYLQAVNFVSSFVIRPCVYIQTTPSKRICPTKRNLRIQPLCIIRLNMRIPHHPPLIHQQRTRHRNLQRIIPIMLPQIRPNRLERRPHSLRLLPHDPELPREFIANVRQDNELELVLLRRAEGLVWKLGRDGHEGYAFGFEGLEVHLEIVQREVAEGTPAAAVEGDEDRALGEELGAGGFASRGVGEGEGGESGAGLDGGGVGEGGDYFGSGCVDGVLDVGRYVAVEAVEDGGELGCEGHGGSWGGVGLMLGRVECLSRLMRRND